jgi:hypothetical protein
MRGVDGDVSRSRVIGPMQEPSFPSHDAETLSVVSQELHEIAMPLMVG